MTKKNKPQGFESVLGDEEVCIRDSNCKLPVYWGYKLLEQIGEERFKELKLVAEVKFAPGPKYPEGTWFVVSQVLSYQDALVLYGPATGIEYGPRGGFRNVTFGEITFSSKELLPPPIEAMHIGEVPVNA